MRNVRVEDLPDGGVRLVACDWPWAGWFAALTGVPGLALCVWSAVEGRWIELGGAAVFCAFGAVSCWLALAKRRRVEIRRTELVAREGAGPFARAVRHALEAPPAFTLEPFERAEGAPDLPDRGADLVLVAGDLRYHLARAVGAAWTELGPVRDRLAAASDR